MARRLTRQRGTQLRTVARIAQRLRPVLLRGLQQLGTLLGPADWLGAAALRIMPPGVVWRLRAALATLEAELVRRLVAEALTESFFDADRPVLTEQTTPDELARLRIGALIQQLEDEALAAVRLQLSLIADAGITPEAIRAIGQATGLTERQVAQVERARRAALTAGASEASAARTAAGVRAKLLDQRARLIARHETVSFVNETIRERGLQVEAAGSRVLKQSVSARDEHVDGGNPFGICRVLDDGKRIPIGDKFMFEGQAFDGPPYHVGCRDILELWVDE